MTKIYTRRGDNGMTDLVGGVRISKADVRLEAYGTIDELSSHLGLLVAMMEQGEEREHIIRVQNNLFCVASHLATDQSQTPLYPSAFLPQGETEQLEQRIDKLKGQLPEAQGRVQPLILFVALFCRQFDGLGGVCRFQKADRQPRGAFSIALSLVVSVDIEAPGIGVAVPQPSGKVDKADRLVVFVIDQAGIVVLRE